MLYFTQSNLPIKIEGSLQKPSFQTINFATMTRVQKCKNLLCGVGALGGTVAIFATVLEKFYGDESEHGIRFRAPQLTLSQ